MEDRFIAEITIVDDEVRYIRALNVIRV